MKQCAGVFRGTFVGAGGSTVRGDKRCTKPAGHDGDHHWHAEEYRLWLSGEWADDNEGDTP